MVYTSFQGLINGLYEVLKKIYVFIASDFFYNVISLIELILAIATIIIGGKKVKEFIQEYKRKQINAIFGYYINLGYFIKRIRALIISDSKNPMKTLYLLSSSDEIRKKAKGFENLGYKLSSVAHECLQYLSTEANQIPPFDYDETKRADWEKDIDNFITYLNQFYLIDSGVHLPSLESEDGIKIYCSNIQKTLENIEKKANDATKNFYQNMINEMER